MSINKAIIDTDILSAIMKGNTVVDKKATDYLNIHKQFTFSIITKYEILRGLKAKKAKRQISNFEQFCIVNEIIPITDEVIEKSSDIYSDLHQKGQIIGDADIFIAATAICNGLTVITNNIEHFKRVTNLTIENWLI